MKGPRTRSTAFMAVFFTCFHHATHAYTWEALLTNDTGHRLIAYFAPRRFDVIDHDLVHRTTGTTVILKPYEHTSIELVTNNLGWPYRKNMYSFIIAPLDETPQPIYGYIDLAKDSAHQSRYHLHISSRPVVYANASRECHTTVLDIHADLFRFR